MARVPKITGIKQESTTAAEVLKSDFVTVKLSKEAALKYLGGIPTTLYALGRSIQFQDMTATVHPDIQAYLAEQGLIEVE